MDIFSDAVDRSHYVFRSDGSIVWVAPDSLRKHGLKQAQHLNDDVWNALGWELASEWVKYVQSCDDKPST